MRQLVITDEQVESIILECKIKVRYRNVDIIRELAKRPEVKMMYSISKSAGIPWFKGTVSELNPLQKRLIYWCSFYDNVGQASDRPPDRVIENDNMLDRWLEKKAKEMTERFESDWAKGFAGLKKSAYDQDEVWEIN
jgi:hypothetical protein